MENIKCNHPIFGWVVFTGPTNRQLDILNIYNEVEQLVKTYPNDSKLGEEIRKIFNSQK